MSIQNLFTTPIKIISLPNTKDIISAINKCTELGFEKNFYERLEKEEAEKIQNIFTNEAELFVKEILNKKINLVFINSWVNYTKKYEINTPHGHSYVSVVGVYYVKTNEKSGDLLLHDPRGVTNMFLNSEIDTSGNLVDGRAYFRFKPKIGDLILFPSYLMHSVEPNMSDEIRISLAMNFKHYET
jgi:uncharacterized protein (TIGR02466 family)